MPKTSKTKISADEVTEKASRGKDVSAYFTNQFTVVRPVRRVNVDLTPGMLRQANEGRPTEYQSASRDQNLAQSSIGGATSEGASSQKGGLIRRDAITLGSTAARGCPVRPIRPSQEPDQALSVIPTTVEHGIGHSLVALP